MKTRQLLFPLMLVGSIYSTVACGDDDDDGSVEGVLCQNSIADKSCRPLVVVRDSAQRLPPPAGAGRVGVGG